MKSDWLPSMHALRAFEAVSRHLSYQHAAEELNVTPAAVKQLVTKLEQSLGSEFERNRADTRQYLATSACCRRLLGSFLRRILRGCNAGSLRTPWYLTFFTVVLTARQAKKKIKINEEEEYDGEGNEERHMRIILDDLSDELKQRERFFNHPPAGSTMAWRWRHCYCG